MKAMKWLPLLILGLALLQGCGNKHGFEGEYNLVMTSSIPELADGMQELMGLLGSQAPTLVIGPDYIERDGIRTQFDKIYRKKSGSAEYLLFESGSKTESWRIEPDGRLVQTAGGLMGYSLIPKPPGNQ